MSMHDLDMEFSGPSWLDDIRREARAIVQPCDARHFHRSLSAALRALGWNVVDEFPIWYRRRDSTAMLKGRIDIVVLMPVRLAIELDAATVRKKSWDKLLQFDGHGLAITRKTPIGFHRLDNTGLTGVSERSRAAESAKGSASRRSRQGILKDFAT